MFDADASLRRYLMKFTIVNDYKPQRKQASNSNTVFVELHQKNLKQRTVFVTIFSITCTTKLHVSNQMLSSVFHTEQISPFHLNALGILFVLIFTHVRDVAQFPLLTAMNENRRFINFKESHPPSLISIWRK